MRKLYLCIILLSFLFASTANALSGIDFLQIESSSQKRRIIEPIIVEFVEKGYTNVPDWVDLDQVIERLIRNEGWASDDINKIALEAATKLGMRKK